MTTAEIPMHLRSFEEVRGKLQRFEINGKRIDLTIELTPSRLYLTLSRDQLLGDLPKQGSEIAVLRTDLGYRVISLASSQKGKRPRTYGT